MNQLSEKVFLQLTMPREDAPVSDHRRVVLALNTLGYEPVTVPLEVLRKLYPLCREADFDITVTLVRREWDWVVTHVEPGDRRGHHYGLAVDYGSTNLVMQLVDLNSGSIIEEVSELNGQVAFGTDILSRITYAFGSPERARQLQRATVGSFHALMDRQRMREARELAENIYCVQFASVPDFLVRMQAAKFVPHTDMKKFPSFRAAEG